MKTFDEPRLKRGERITVTYTRKDGHRESRPFGLNFASRNGYLPRDRKEK